jgi:DNA-directed RNA polymerase delta subunit
VKVGRGTWGLKEWYPNRDFKKKSASKETNGVTSEKDELEDLV